MDIEKTMQFLLEQQARFDARQAQSDERIARVESLLAEVAMVQANTNAILATLAERHVELAEAQKRSHLELSEAQKTTEERLNALIVAVERHISNHK